MSLRAGFAAIEITPSPGTHKVGWLSDIVGEGVADPLYARVAVFESNGETIAFVQLDTLSIRWTQTSQIRGRVAAAYGYPAERVMVAATHNHAGPAVARAGEVERDDEYVTLLVDRVVAAFGEALDHRKPVAIGVGTCFEFEVAYNRRVVQRDGTVKTHGRFDHPDALCLEGPIDPEVAVLAARSLDGELLGALVNFACHPTHHGGDTLLSAGWPGALANSLGARGCPVTMLLNGAAGNIHFSSPAGGGLDMAAIGERLADDVTDVIGTMDWRREVRLSSRNRTIRLPYRELTEAECSGTVRGAQPFRDRALYNASIERLKRRVAERGTQPAEVQVHSLDEYAFVSIPAEYFVELGLEIKERAYPRHALIVGYANGMVGYIPTAAAFERGGYETTLIESSRMAPECGELLADLAIELISETGSG